MVSINIMVSEMRMVRWMCGIKQKKIPNKELRERD